MTSDFICFPANARRFHLRADFPYELCYGDFARSRAARKAINAGCLNGASIQFEDYPPDPDLLKIHRPPRFFVYCTAVIKNTLRPVHLIGDAEIWMPTWGGGLFADMLCRANRSLERSADQPVAARAIPKTPVNKWLFPNELVLHDTAFSSAAVMSYNTAQGYLAMNRAE